MEEENNKEMKSIKYLFILIAILNAPFYIGAGSDAPSDWTLIRQEEGMTVYSRDPDESDIKEIRVTFTVRSTMEKAIEVLADVPAYENWVYKCSHSESIKTINENEFYYYTVSDFPFPFEDRDLVIKSEHWMDDSNGSYHSHSVAVKDIVDEKEGIVRIPTFSSTWSIKPIENQQLQIEYQVNSSAGGIIPTWLVNLAVAKGPLETMIAFKALVAN
jgi:hypothetical protein